MAVLRNIIIKSIKNTQIIELNRTRKALQQTNDTHLYSVAVDQKRLTTIDNSIAWY